MRVEFLFNTEVQSKEVYLTQAATWIDSIRNGKLISDGRCLKEELSGIEKSDLESYIMEMLMPEIEMIAKAKKRKANLDYDKAEDFKAILIMKTYEDFYKFNNSSYLNDKEKQYTISTFLEHKSHEAMRDMMIEERNLPANAIRNLGIINDAIIEISKNEEIGFDAVSPLMVYEKLSGKSISYKMVITLMDIYHGVISIDEMEDSDGRLQDNTMEMESKIAQGVDDYTKKVLDDFFADFSKLEFYIFMKEFGFLGEKVRSMTVKELSYQDYFVTLAKEDKDGEKNIEFGNVHIKRPGRNSGTEDEVFVESIYYVKEKFYSNKVAKIKKKLATLAGKIALNDVAGCMEEYCIRLWKERYL